MYRGEEKGIQDFWWRKLNERDRLADEQIINFVDVQIQALLNTTLDRR
jgi:hypothetical protein